MSINQITTLGIVGGNLTAALLCLEASKKGIKTILLDKQVGNIASEFASSHITAEATRENIEKLMLKTDAVLICTGQIGSIADSKIKGVCYPEEAGRKLITSRLDQIQAATNLEIPVPSYFYQNNKEDIFEKLEDIRLPFTFYQIYPGSYEAMDILSEEELADFIYEVDEEADGWLLEQINDYQKILSITAIKDHKGKICTYPIAEEFVDDDEVNYINIPAAIPKATATKIVRYAKKLLKTVETTGVFTFKFGMKANKGLELLHVTPGITIGDIATLHYTDLSVYEQYINMVCGLGIIEPTVLRPSTVIITKQHECPAGVKLPYHLYVVDKYTQSPINIYVIPNEQAE